MRIRTIKPEFWSSDDVAALDWSTRLVFIGLWSYVDDNGVGRDNERLIMSDLFPQEEDPRDTLAKVSRALEALHSAGLITRYTVDDKPYILVNGFGAHQRVDRPGKPRYPLPTCDDASPRETVASPRETLAPVTGEKGNREQGTGEQGTGEVADLAVRDEPPSDRPEVEALCHRLADRIEANGSRRPRITKAWRDSCRLLIDRDGRNPVEIARAIDWSQSDPFWRANVLSMATLRDKYDRMRLQAERGANPTGPPARTSPGDRALQLLADLPKETA